MVVSDALYRVQIDWFADGDFTDDIDNVSDDVLARGGLVVEYGRDTARSTAPPMIGASDCLLNNEHRGYSPENPATSRYQFVKPGRPYRVQVAFGADRIPYRTHLQYRSHTLYRAIPIIPLFLGYTSRFEQHAEIGDRSVSVTALGTIAKLQRTVVSVEKKGSTRVDTAIGHVLDAAGWPASLSNLSTGDAVMQHWWVDERSAWDVLVELIATEGAGSLLYEDPDGVLHFQNRNYRTTVTRSTTSQMTLHDGTGLTGYPYQHLRYDPRWEDVVSRVTADMIQRAVLASQVVWELGSDLALTAAEVRTIWARPDAPVGNAITPVLTTDYTVSGGTVSMALNWTAGAAVEITVTATSGTPTVSGLQLRAEPWPEVGRTLIEAEQTPDVASDAKTLKLAVWPELDPNHAQAICDSYLARYGAALPLAELTMRTEDDAMLEDLLALRPSDRVTVVNAHLGLNTDFWIERIRHTIGAGVQHDLTLFLETCSAVGSGGGLWDVGLWDSAIWGI